MTLQFSPDGRWLASGSKDRYIRLWDLEGNREPVILNGHRDEVTAIAFSPDGRLLASGDARGELKFCLHEEAAELTAIKGFAPIERLIFSPRGNRLALQTDRQIRVFNATAGKFLATEAVTSSKGGAR